MGGAAGTGGAGPWFDPAWTRRRAIDVTSVTGGPHAGFVVRVRLDEARIDMEATNAGQDLRFVADDHGTVLDHEVEHWSTEGDVWVRLPSLDTGDRFFMYYGNPEASATQATPFDGYAAVWHLGDETDASGAGAGATPASGVSYVPGRIGLASAHAPSTSSELDVPSQGSIEDLFAAGGTISVWIRAVSTGGEGFGRIADKATTLAGTDGWTFHLQTVGLNAPGFGLSFERGFTGMPGNFRTDSLTSMSLGQWYHLALVHDDTAPANTRWYVDGQPIPMNITLPSGFPESDAAVGLRLGNESQTSTRSFDGLIDELRLERVARSPGWIETDHRSGADQLLTFGPEEVCPASVCP